MKAILLLLLLLPAAVASAPAGTADYARLVNPLIGTGGHGHTFPGASLPFGMVQLSPDTRVQGWDACAGYHYSDSTILGFSHTHLSGTGAIDYGDILLMPTIGVLQLTPGSEDQPQSGYRSRFRHATEQAHAGYYRVLLEEHGIAVELTTTARAGLHKYVFPASSEANIILDLLHGLGPDRVLEAELEFVSDTEIAGLRRSQGWAADQRVYFVAQFSQPFAACGVAEGGPDSSRPGQSRGHESAGFRALHHAAAAGDSGKSRPLGGQYCRRAAQFAAGDSGLGFCPRAAGG